MTTAKTKALVNILVNKYEDNERFGEPAFVVEMTVDVGNQLAMAGVDFVIKAGRRCSVSMAYGTQTGMTLLTKEFIKQYKPAVLVNQVSKASELKAMYRAGLRIPNDLYNRYTSIEKSLDVLNRCRSVTMYLNK